MRKSLLSIAVLLFVAGVTAAQQSSMNDEGGRVMALENAWNRALEAKDTKALDMLLANTFVSIDIDGSISSKSEFLASIKSPDYQVAGLPAVASRHRAKQRPSVRGCRGNRRSVSNQRDGERKTLRSPRTISRYLDKGPWNVAVCGHDEHADHCEIGG